VWRLFLYLFLTPFYFAFPAAIVHPRREWADEPCGCRLPVLKYFFSRTKAGKAFVKSSKFWQGLATARASSHSSSGVVELGRGFSGGGGSFGGGGRLELLVAGRSASTHPGKRGALRPPTRAEGEDELPG